MNQLTRHDPFDDFFRGFFVRPVEMGKGVEVPDIKVDVVGIRPGEKLHEVLISEDRLSSGMIPKVGACVHALRRGVERAHILNGTIPHALLLEVYTDEGVGTMITGESASLGLADDATYTAYEGEVTL